MNEIVNKLLSAGDKFIPEMHLRQPRFTYSACGAFTKNKERIQKFKETGDSRHIYQNKLGKTCFKHDRASGDSKDLSRRTACEKILRDKASNIAKNPKYNGYQHGLASMVYKFFDKNPASLSDKSASIGAIKNEIMSNKESAEKLRKPIIRKFETRKVCSTFVDNMWGADLASMQLISKFNKGFRFLLWVIDIFSKYAWVIPFKDKKGIPNTNAFQKFLDEPNRKLNKIWVDKGSEFYNRPIKSWLQDNNIEMYSAHNEGKSVIAEGFTRTLRNKIYKYMTSISKNVCIDK